MKKASTLIISLLFTIFSFAQSQRLVLFEEFTGENCPPCSEINPYVDALANAYPNEVVLIHYLAPVPTPGILSEQVSGVVGGRMGFYGVNSTPWGQEDGFMWDSVLLSTTQDGNNPITWCLDNNNNLNPNFLNAEYAVPSPFNISIADNITGVSDSFYATVTVTASEAVTLPGSVKLQLAMVENLQFEAAPGNNGETSWSNAVRAMYPSYIGTTLPLTWTNGQIATYSFKGKVPLFIHDKTKVRFVAFIQDITTKLVQQTAISNFSTFNIDIAATGVQGNFANCYSPQYTPTLNFSNVGNQTIASCYISEYLDNAFLDSVPWTGSLASGAATNQTLAPLTITPGIHKLSFRLSVPNHQVDQNLPNDSVSLMVNIPSPEVNTPVTEGFETGDPTIVGGGWSVESPDHDSTWRVVNTGQASAHSFMLYYVASVFQEDFVNPINNLYAPPINLTYAAHATVKFSFANQWIEVGTNQYGFDSLDIDVSTDCGNSWTTVYNTNLATAPAGNINALYSFTPTSTQWKTDSADISIAANHDDVLLRFRPQNFDGNNLYLDNINIYKYDSIAYTGIPVINNMQSVSVYPNPSNNQVNVSVLLQNDASVGYQLTDVTGKILVNSSAEVRNAGPNLFSINTSGISDGVYFVTVTAGTDRISKLIAIAH